MGHPAHFYLFRNLIYLFKKHQFDFVIVIKTKDILEQLCINEGFEYINVLPVYRKNNFFSFVLSYLKKYIRISKIILKHKPQVMVGSEPSLTHLGKLFRIKSVIFCEDDTAIIPRFAKIAYPFADAILAPISCNLGKWEYKKSAYFGFQKLAYLHPSVFHPDRSLISEIGEGDYFIIRLTELAAYHDDNIKGIQKELLSQIIHRLEKKGKVFITSEKTLTQDLLKYQLPIKPENIHHALYFAKMYIGDSQSMAVEAALLGTPGIRFNDFVGEIGVLNEIENVYGLSFAFKTNDSLGLLNRIDSILKSESIQKEFKMNRQKLLSEKINVTDFYFWFLVNFPESKSQLAETPSIQESFKI